MLEYPTNALTQKTVFVKHVRTTQGTEICRKRLGRTALGDDSPHSLPFLRGDFLGGIIIASLHIMQGLFQVLEHIAPLTVLEAFKLHFKCLFFTYEAEPWAIAVMWVYLRKLTPMSISFSDQKGEIVYYLRKDREILFSQQMLSVSRNYLKCARDSKCQRLTPLNSLKRPPPRHYPDTNYFLLRITLQGTPFKWKRFQRKWEFFGIAHFHD